MRSRISKKLLIIGTLPPPIGGVTIHVKRLVENLKKSDFDYKFIPLIPRKLFKIIEGIINSKVVHLHTSSPYSRCFFSVICFFLGKYCIITYHGNIGRYNFLKNYFDRISIRFVKKPLLLNRHSYDIAKKINNRSCIVSAFIPPMTVGQLKDETLGEVEQLKNNFHNIFCTNAFNVSFDKNKKEIYQISDLIKVFNLETGNALIVSDPSGNYFKFIREKKLVYGKNVFFISFPHDFNAVILKSDCLIRYTTTDGDSISVKEALTLGVPVIATNIVDRPKEVILIGNSTQELRMAINNFKKPTQKIEFSQNGFIFLSSLYYEALGI